LPSAIRSAALACVAISVFAPARSNAEPARHYAGREVALRDGKLYVDGSWQFLKIGKPLINFADETAVQQLAADLPTLQAKGYNTLELNCYWHQLDVDGDGQPEGDLLPLRRLVDAIVERGMFACLSVETYGVGVDRFRSHFSSGSRMCGR